MFTENYNTYKKLMRAGGSTYSGHTESLYFTQVDGAKVGGNNPAIHANYSYRGDFGYWLAIAKCGTISAGQKTSMGGGVYFGTGSTPATKNDYVLESPITSGLSITNPSQYSFTEDENGKQVYSASYVLKNTTGAEINIWEIGLYTSVHFSETGCYHVLMERTVLSEPITIPAGESKLVTYKITFNQTLNVEA